MAPFDRSHATSYKSAIVSVARSCTIFEIFDIEDYRYLEIQIRCHRASLCTATAHTSLNSTDPELYFAMHSEPRKKLWL